MYFDLSLSLLQAGILTRTSLPGRYRLELRISAQPSGIVSHTPKRTRRVGSFSNTSWLS